MKAPSRVDVRSIVRDRRARTLGKVVALIAVLAALFAVIHGGGSGNANPLGSVSGAQSPQTSAYGPLVSRGKPVACSRAEAQVGGSHALTSGLYGQWSYWGPFNNRLPESCAIHIGVGPSRLMVVWYSNYDATNYIQDSGRMPQDYTLSVSANSTNGQDGAWRVVTTVTGNQTRVRETVIPFTGDAWLKMTITKGPAHPTQNTMAIDQIDCYDVSASLKNTTLFEGDSITALSYDRSDSAHPSFDTLMHQYDSRLFPPMLDEGLAGWASGSAVAHIDTWLALNPDIHYWLLEWGTNDSSYGVSPEVFRSNMQLLIDKIEAAGHVPVLARIPPVRIAGSDGVQQNAAIDALNQQIDALTQANHLIPGPDLHLLVSQHESEYLGPDGIHPTHLGVAALNNAWYLAMRATLRANV